MKKISIVIPAKNEEDTLNRVLSDVQKTQNILEQNYEVEVIVVDDHSTDKTSEIAIKNGVKLIKNTGTSGKGCALRVGFAASEGEFIVMLDADYSHRAE